MEHQMIVTVGYTDYAIDPLDAVVLLGLAKRMRKVRRGVKYNDPRIVEEDQAPFVTSMELAVVIDREPEPEPEETQPAP